MSDQAYRRLKDDFEKNYAGAQNNGKFLIIEEGAMKRAPEMFRSLFGNQKAIVVADTNTWKAAGQYVQKYLEEAGIVTE